jgi:hypothetical protein
MSLGSRRAGRAQAFDVFNGTTGAVAVRNIDAETVIASYCTSLTAEEVMAGVAASSYVDSDGFRCTSRMAIMFTPPTINTPLDDRTGNKDIELTPYQFAANSFEGPGLVYSATLASGAALPAWLVFDGLTRTFSGTPDETGTFVIRVKAKDPTTGLSVSDDFDLTISA